MGFSYQIFVKEEDIIKDINAFNDKYQGKHEENTEIERTKDEIILHNIEQDGFNKLCYLRLNNLKSLYLDYNNIDSIECLAHFIAPNLINLNLSYNKIQKIDVLKKVVFPLETLDLSYNVINNINIFKDEKTLPKLKNLLLKNNDIDFDDKKIKNIMTKLYERISLNNEESIVESNNDESYKLILKNVKTINNISNTNFGIFENNVILKMRTIKNLSEIHKNMINEIEKFRSNYKKKSVNNNIKANPLDNVKNTLKGAKTFKKN